MTNAISIKQARQKAKMTQTQAAAFTGIPLRTYVRYENGSSGISQIKKDYIKGKLVELTEITESKGILDLEDLKKEVSTVCKKNNIGICFLFGSYAKGYATEKSDVDLLVETNKTGLAFFGLVEEFRQALHKKVDVLRIEDIQNNRELLTEILKDGIRIDE